MTSPSTVLLPEVLIRLPQVLAAYPVSRSAWYAGIKSGIYPAPYKLSERTAAWKISDIKALIASHDKAANDAKGA